jgi:hypothetical protein
VEHFHFSSVWIARALKGLIRAAGLSYELHSACQQIAIRSFFGYLDGTVLLFSDWGLQTGAAECPKSMAQFGARVMEFSVRS